MSMHCPSCQFENPADAKFCLECGHRLKRSADPLVGQQIGNHRLVERIGVGGMGVIYRAEHVNLGKIYAIKFLHPQFAADEEVVERFRREAQVIASLDHENIVRETDFGWLDGVGFYLVMEFLKGETLKEVIKREGVLEPERVLALYEQLLDALDVAHGESVVHRDLKPENLFLVTRRGKEQLKILDFGIARIAYDTEKKEEFTVDGEVYGSPTYMSPEQARGDISRVDPRSDLYSAGVILVEALTGRPPYQGSTPAEVMLSHISTLPPRISDLKPNLLFAPELEDVVIKSLAKESEDRFQSAHELWQALKPALLRTIELRKSAPPPSPEKPTREIRKVSTGTAGDQVDYEQATGKMEGQAAPQWFVQENSQPGIEPNVAVNLTELEVPAITSEPFAPPTMLEGSQAALTPPPPPNAIMPPPPPQTTPPPPPRTGVPSSVENLPQVPPPSWPFPAAQPVPASDPALPQHTGSLAGNVSLQHPPSPMTPTPSLKPPDGIGPSSSGSYTDLYAAGQIPGAFPPPSASVSLAGQPSPYIEATPKPHTMAASQLTSEAAVSLTPSRGYPPHSVSVSEPDQHAAQPPAWSEDMLAEAERTNPGFDPNKTAETEADSPAKPPVHKRPFVWMILLASLVTMVFGAIKLLVPAGGGDDPSVTMSQDGGLPSLPSPSLPTPPSRAHQLRRARQARQARRIRKTVRRQKRVRPAPRSRRADQIVQYQPPSRRDNDTSSTTSKSYRLHIRSTPSGADVYLAGQGKVATTPFTLQFISGSQVTLLIRKDGYLTRAIKWRAEGHNRVHITLAPDPSQ